MSSDPAMTDIVKGMARCFEIASDKGTYDEEAMRGALLWLADNVSKEMSVAFWNEFYREYRTGGQAETVNAISAAIRAAAGEEGK